VKLADRKVRLKRPRLRHKTNGEVQVPAYESLRADRGLSEQMLARLSHLKAIFGVGAGEFRLLSTTVVVKEAR
jgi:hypothetical protein